MRSDVIRVSASGAGMNEALAQAEAVAVYKGLSDKETLRLRLMAEEMMGMLRGLTGEVEAEFYIEDEDRDFRLHLSTVTVMTGEKRRKLMECATSGKNSAAVGIMGKIRSLFDVLLEADSEPASLLAFNMMVNEIDRFGVSATWSLMDYRQIVGERRDAEEWDELERSIVANIADEIKVFINGGKVELVIFKKF